MLYKKSWIKYKNSDLSILTLSRIDITQHRSSRTEVFSIKGVLKIFAKFTGKYLFQSLLINKDAGIRPETLLKKETLAQVFSCEFCEISKNIFFSQNTSSGCFCQQTFTGSKWTIETLEKGAKYVQSQQWRQQYGIRFCSGTLIVNFDHISHLFLMFLWLALNR